MASLPGRPCLKKAYSGVNPPGSKSFEECGQDSPHWPDPQEKWDIRNATFSRWLTGSQIPEVQVLRQTKGFIGISNIKFSMKRVKMKATIDLRESAELRNKLT